MYTEGANVLSSIGADSETVHTGLIVYLVDLWQDGRKKPLVDFFSGLGLDLTAYERLSARKEYEKIDLVLFDGEKDVVAAIEMKVHNHESCVNAKKPRSGRAYQTVEYPQRLDARCFFYVTLGTGEFFRETPYGNDVEQIGLERFHDAVQKISGLDYIIEAWRELLCNELKLRKACEKGDASSLGAADVKKWNLYFLGFLRKELDKRLSCLNETDLTVYRHSQDTILNTGIKKPAGANGSYCYMEINSNGKLNLKINLEPLEQSEKRKYASEALEHYERIFPDVKWSHESADVRLTNLKKSKTLLSFKIGIERTSEGLFKHAVSEGRTCEKVREIVQWFSDETAVVT